ncbi:hypothetical protein [Mesorhizobium sp. LSJC264A00]|uniref:hypothetical protein n=1 Tax=unclassified Mesorhizobium TaxID=325217 RepID=UPI0003CE409D|nr:hypothetical protein [Mesorhizobium sp. LSJC264A00]ESX23023.1 hypothetical protein X767_16720 [Mesorhizobium sp. LSJC264A00]
MVGTGVFRDGMTVGEYLRAARSRDVAIRQIASSLKTKAISIEETFGPAPEATE